MMRNARYDKDWPRLTVTVQRSVRLEDVDALGIMWHGRYPSWFEDGREALGRRYNIHYLDFYHHGLLTPVKKMSIDYDKPLHYGKSYLIETSLLWSESARMDWEYHLRDMIDHQILTTAYITQLFVDLSGRLQLDIPLFYKKFLSHWKHNTLSVSDEVLINFAQERQF